MELFMYLQNNYSAYIFNIVYGENATVQKMYFFVLHVYVEVIFCVMLMATETYTII